MQPPFSYYIVTACNTSSMYFETTTSHPKALPTKKTLAALPHPEWIPAQMLEYARNINGRRHEWHTPADGSGRPAFWGGFNLQSIEAIYGDWFGHVYFASDPADSRMRHFKVVDWCSNEVCVGLYHDAQQDPGLYFFRPGEGEDPYPLHLDLGGYVQLLLESLGYQLWPLALLAQLPDDGLNPAYHSNRGYVEDFRQNMSAWADLFDYGAFVALYQQLRLPARP